MRRPTNLLQPLVVSSALLMTGAMLPVPLKGQSGTIRGTATNSFYGRPLENVQVTVLGAALGTLTNANGEFIFLNVPAGNYTVQASLLGYDVLQTPVDLTPGEVEIIAFDFREPWANNIPPIQPGSRLDSLQQVYQDSLALLLSQDIQDRSRIPAWFRAFLRHSMPQLPTAGPLQYPMSATELFQWMLLHQDLGTTPRGGGVVPAAILGTGLTVPSPEPAPPPADGPVRSAVVGGDNANLTNTSELAQRETSVAIHPGSERYVLAAANNLRDNPASLATFWSSDFGCSWLSSQLPMGEGENSHVDPSVAWSPDGTGWVAAVVKDWDNPGGMYQIQLFRTDNRGVTFQYEATVSEGTGNDKGMIAVAPAGVPHAGRLYAAWSQFSPGRMRFRWRDTNGSWSPVITLSDRVGIGAHIAVGSLGEVYVAWTDIDPSPGANHSLKVRVSRDGGQSFDAATTISSLRASGYRISVPAACNQLPPIYPVLSVSTTPTATGLPSPVFVVWMDLDRLAPDPKCGGLNDNAHTNTYLSLSPDQGKTWISPFPLAPTDPKTDQFNPWLALDPATGNLHVTHYSTPVGQRTRTHLLHLSSQDQSSAQAQAQGLLTASPEVSNAWTDDVNAPGVSQYGHYNGLAVMKGVAVPLWTDHRPNLPGDRHQVFSAIVDGGSRKPLNCPTTAIQFETPPLTSLKPGTTTPVTALVTRGGIPATGEWLGVGVTPEGVASLDAASVQSDEMGRVHVDVTGLQKGSAEIVAAGAGTVATLAVQVAGGGPGWPWWLWALIILGAVALGLFLVFVWLL
jgi:hypothetical protein